MDAKMTLAFNLAHGSVISFGVVMFYLSRPGSSLFSYHPALMSVGTLVFCFESLLLLKDKRIPKKKKIFVHWLTSVIGIVITLLALQAVYRVKNYKNRPHFATWHGLFGIALIAVLIFQNISGIPLKYAKVVTNYTGIHRSLTHQIHEVGSLISGILGAGTIITAFCSSWFLSEIGGGIFWYVLLAMVMLPRFFFGYLMQQKKLKKQKNKEKRKEQHDKDEKIKTAE